MTAKTSRASAFDRRTSLVDGVENILREHGVFELKINPSSPDVSSFAAARRRRLAEDIVDWWEDERPSL